MSGKGAWLTDRQLWQRWRALDGALLTAAPDALSLAAYAEGRLGESEAEAPAPAFIYRRMSAEAAKAAEPV